MISKVKIAIIDNGINRKLVEEKKLKDELTVGENKICIKDYSEPQTTDYLHGTICALIIVKYCSECLFSSIRILNQEGKGGSEKIEPALEWCYQNNIKVINLSLGTTCFKESEKLNRVINKYVNRGLIIVAATSNIGFFTSPASFTNVIGVTTMDSPLSYINDYMHLGIDTVVSSEHIIKLGDKEYKTSPSNSNAAPYVSAVVAQKITDDETCDIHTLKKYVREKSHIVMEDGLYTPDWVYKAYMHNRKNESKAAYYFETVTGRYEDIEHEVDTIIARSKSELEQINIENKNLIYLGNGDIENINLSGFRWSRRTKIKQIVSNQYQGNGLDIPLIILDIEDSLDEYYIMSEFRKLFEKNGYNAYVIGNKPESVIYRLEYIPDINTPLTEQLVKDYIEGQIYYKQSDLILWSLTKRQKKTICNMYPDYDIEIIFGKSEFLVYAEENLLLKKIYDDITYEYIKKVYSIIMNCLMEDEHE